MTRAYWKKGTGAIISQSIGIFAKTFPRLSLESNLDVVARYRVPVVQYNMACAGLSSLPDEIPSGLAGRIGVAAAARGIRIASVSGTFNMVHPDVEQRRRGLRSLEVLAAACKALGTQCITLCTGSRDAEDMWRGHRDNTSPGAWMDLLASMEAAVAIAEAYEVVLGIEPEVANVVDSAAKAQLLLREMRSASLKVVFDPANLFGPGDLAHQYEIVEDAFDALAPHIIMAHARDVVESGGQVRQVAAGTGQLDYSFYLSLLGEVRVPLVVHGLSEQEVPWSLAFLRATAEGSKLQRARVS
jgi:sugar phosphate isomerase/epimerase